jgi:hypothetical protein
MRLLAAVLFDKSQIGGTNDIVNMAGSYTNGVTQFTFSRLLDTKDSVADLVITNSLLYLQWAYYPQAGDASDNYPVHTAAGCGAAVANFYTGTLLL